MARKAKTATRDEEERRNSHFDPGWSGNVRSESSVARDKSERTYRANSERTSLIDFRSSDHGGVFRELIAEYRSQVALKLGMINSLQEEVKQARIKDSAI